MEVVVGRHRRTDPHRRALRGALDRGSSAEAHAPENWGPPQLGGLLMILVDPTIFVAGLAALFYRSRGESGGEPEGEVV